MTSYVCAVGDASSPTCATCRHATHGYPGDGRILWCLWWEHATEPDTTCSHCMTPEPEPWDGPAATDGLDDGEEHHRGIIAAWPRHT